MASKLTSNITTLYQERPKVALLMSLGGSNANRILADEEIHDLYDITSIVTDRPSSRAVALAEQYRIDFVPEYVSRFPSQEHRKAYFDALCNKLAKKGVQACFYAGFMKIAAGDIIDILPGVNAHPADLTDIDNSGIPRFRGMHAINLMRQATAGTIGASVHGVDHEVDAGDTFIRSEPIQADASLSENDCHMLIKPIEHIIYPMALRLLGRGALKIEDMPYSYNSLTETLTTHSGEPT